MWIDAASGAITTHYELVYQLDIEPVLGLFDTGVLPSMVGERYVCDQWSKVVVDDSYCLVDNEIARSGQRGAIEARRNLNGLAV